MRHSIFWKMVLLIFPFLMLINATVLIIAFRVAYDEAIEHCEDDVKADSITAALLFSNFDPNDQISMEKCDKQFETLCDANGLTYVYAEKIDLDGDTHEFMSIGFGEEANDEAKNNRYAGVVVDGVSEDKRNALTSGESVFHRDNNEFGDMIVCYTPVKGEKIPENTYLVGAELSVRSLISSVSTAFITIALFVFITNLVIVLMIAFIFRRSVFRPAQLISKRMTKFVSDRESDFEPIKVIGNDEFAEMASSFNTMAQDIDRYIEDIYELNLQRSTQEAELNIARNIQMGLLAPTSFRGKTAEINACMLPARDVGGDLYDYRVLDDGRIFVVIADVSGKGISAALFMSRAITMLTQYAESGLSPGSILFEYNNHLAEHNPNIMFITTFVGIYDPKTNEFVYSNAGHNDPYLLSDELITLDGAHGTAAGIFKDEKYDESTVVLKPGDKLFLYTDGVTEAKNSKNKLFGDDRLREALTDSSEDNALARVLKRVDKFSENTAQSDDITILTLTVPEKYSRHLCLEAKKENIREIIEEIASLDISDTDKQQIRLIAEEIFVNICSYAYEGETGEAELDIELDGGMIRLVFTDSGKPYDPTQNVPDIEKYDYENKIGGLGIFLTTEIADRCSYEYKDGKNILTLEKSVTKEENNEQDK